MKYPDVKRVDIQDDYHGTMIHDPYRYMENPEDEETKRFVEENNKLVSDHISEDELSHFSSIVRALVEHDKFYVPIQAGNRLFYAKQKPEELQPVIYMREGNEERVLLDLNTLSEDGTTGSMKQFYSNDGKYMVALITEQGSDWQKVYIKDIDSDEVLETINWITMTDIAWNNDNSGFYIRKFPDQTGLGPEEQRRNAKLYFHTIGTSENDDKLIFDPNDPEETPYPLTFKNGKYLFITLTNSTLPQNKLLFREETDGEWKWIVKEYDDSIYIPIGIENDHIYIQTSWEAGNSRIMKIPLENTSRQHWIEIVPESDQVIRGTKFIGGKLVVTVEENVKHLIKVYDMEGNFDHYVDLPSYGQLVSGSYNPNLTGKPQNSLMYFGFTSFKQPMSIYKYDLNSKQLEEFLHPGLDFDTGEININQVFYTSKDGTEIPMYLIHKPGLSKNGENPTFLYGYGGFNISLLPSFNPQALAWVQNGGLFAIANLRGGGEYGKKWHKQALLGNKQNVFDDFIAAAEYLIAENYTNNKQIGINGRSNGGLLVGATLTQRPDLFGAAIPQVGVLDMLRFPVQKDAGRYWVGEYGNAKENEEHFSFLIKYSPYHNVIDGTHYPPTLVTAAEGDDRVAPAHSKKFAAALQHAQAGEDPVLVRIETKAGHGYGKPISKIVEDTAINLAFFNIHLKSD